MHPGRGRRLGPGTLLLTAALFACRSAAAADPAVGETHSAGSSQTVTPVLTTWQEAMARQATMPEPPPRRTGNSKDDDRWWEEIPRSDRHYIAKKEYEDPRAIIAARKRMEQFARDAREAVARGETPPAPWKPHDPARGHRIQAVNNAVTGPLDSWFLEKLLPAGPKGRSGALRGDQPSAPTWYTSWQGIGDGGRPSDSVSAVGPAHVGIMVNSRFAFYTKDGALAVGPMNFEAWWSDSPVPFDLFDPKITYDNHVGRWILLALNGRDVNTENYFAISVSQTSNPEGAWWTYYLRSDVDGGTDTNNWTDYPGLGFDSGNATNSSSGGAIYISSNQYARGGGFNHGKFRVIPKWQIYNGLGVGWWDFWNATVFTWKPAVTHTSTGAAPTEYLIHTMSSGATWLTKWTLTNPLGSGPSLSSDTIFTSLYGVPPNAQQLGGSGSSQLDTGDCRTQDVQYRNGYLYTTAGDFSFWDDLFDTDAVVHYWKINASSGSVVWDGYFGHDDESFSYGKIQVDTNNDATIAFSHTSPSVYARVGMTGRLSTDGGVQSYVVVKSGEATYNPSGDDVERWGDYNGLGVDCAGDQTGMWGISQYATDFNSWQTWVGGTSFGAPNVLHLPDGGSIFTTIAPRDFTWKVQSFDWSGVALYNQIDGDNDLRVSNTCPFGSAYASSAAGTNVRDFTVTNGPQFGTDYHHAHIFKFLTSGPDGYRIEARSASVDVGVGSTASDSFASSQILDLFESGLTSGKTYAAVVDITGGNADLDLWMFKGSRTSGSRAQSDGSSQGTGAGAAGDETLVFTADESSVHGFAVVNENFGTSNYTFRVWLKPLVNAIGNANLAQGAAYTGPTPSLTEGTTPVTWSLDAGPSGMTINGSTGVVAWSPATPGSHTVTIRATNPAGFDAESWTLNVAASTSTPTLVPTATWTRTITPTRTFTATPIPTGTFTATPIPTGTFTATPIPTGTSTATPIPTGTSTATTAPTDTRTPTETFTETPTATPIPTDTPVPTETPTSTSTPLPNDTPTQTPVVPPTFGPTSTGTPVATGTPTETPQQGATPTATQPPGVLLRSPGATGLLLGFLLSLAALSWLWRRPAGS